MCSTSAGSIHTAIRKLLDKEFIFMEEQDTKKVYHIREKGIADFNTWIEKPMDTTKAKKEHEELEVIQKESQKDDTRNMDPKLLEIVKYQQATSQYWLASTEFEINWYTKWLNENEL